MPSCNSGSATVRIIRSAEELEEIRDVWKSWNRHPNADIDFYKLICRVRAEILGPYVLVVQRDGRPDCILIGRLEKTRLDVRVGYLKAFRPQTRVLVFVHGGFLGNTNEENSSLLVSKIIESLNEHKIDAAHFHQLGLHSPLYDSVKQIPGVMFRDHFSPVEVHRHLKLPRTFDEYFANLPRKQRHEVRRHTRMLEHEFSDRVRTQYYGAGANIDELVREAEKVANKTYQRKLRVGFKDGVEMRGILDFAACRGELHACILYVDAEPRAFVIGTLYQNSLHCLSIGYDPEFGRFSVGLLLVMQWIEEAFRRNQNAEITGIDFGSGDARYKSEICNSEWTESSLYVFAPTAKGLALNLVRTASVVCQGFARDLLQRLHLLEETKRAWRRLGAEPTKGAKAIPRISGLSPEYVRNERAIHN